MDQQKEMLELLKSISERVERMENYAVGRYSLLEGYVFELQRLMARIGRHLGLRNKPRQE